MGGSPAVLAARAALADLGAHFAPHLDPGDIAEYLYWRAAPEEAVNAWLRWLGIPSPAFIEPGYERLVMAQAYDVISERNTPAALDRLVADAAPGVIVEWSTGTILPRWSSTTDYVVGDGVYTGSDPNDEAAQWTCIRDVDDAAWPDPYYPPDYPDGWTRQTDGYLRWQSGVAYDSGAEVYDGEPIVRYWQATENVPAFDLSATWTQSHPRLRDGPLFWAPMSGAEWNAFEGLARVWSRPDEDLTPAQLAAASYAVGEVTRIFDDVDWSPQIARALPPPGVVGYPDGSARSWYSLRSGAVPPDGPPERSRAETDRGYPWRLVAGPYYRCIAPVDATSFPDPYRPGVYPEWTERADPSDETVWISGTAYRTGAIVRIIEDSTTLRYLAISDVPAYDRAAARGAATPGEPGGARWWRARNALDRFFARHHLDITLRAGDAILTAEYISEMELWLAWLQPHMIITVGVAS